MRSWILAPLAALALAACAFGEDPAVTAARQACTQIYTDPDLNPIRERATFGSQDATKTSLALLADRGKPNEIERSALQKLDFDNRQCWDGWDRAARPSPVIQQARGIESAALAELFNGVISYGEYNRRRSAAIGDMNARLQEARERELYARRPQPMFCDPVGPYPFATLHCW